MKVQMQEGFMLAGREVINDILNPRYYDPRISEILNGLQNEYTLVSLKELIDQNAVAHSHGSYVPKIFYGTGPFPYVRTSDLANWEIKASPKHGVPETVFEDYSPDQDVCAGDIFFVHEGTYLIGAVAMVTELDGPLLYQHHLAKFRVLPSAPFDAFYLLAAFESPLVHRQVRSKQFSADIIDSVVGRLEEVVIPYPKDTRKLHLTEERVKKSVLGRARLREQIAYTVEAIDRWLQSTSSESLEDILAWEPDPKSSRATAFLGGRRGFTASVLDSTEIVNQVLLPRYYDPVVAELSGQYTKRCTLQTVEQLVNSNLLSIQTGDEIGRLNYGTGDIPFVRTSDFGSWELKRESKQGVSNEVYDAWHASQDVKAGDILLVRDGTYLVGTSVLVCEDDLPLLFCGGIYKLRSLNHDRLPPGLLFALLNTPFVQRQIRNKQFTRDVIDTLGQRLTELLLPLPKVNKVTTAVGEHFRKSLAERTKMRTELHQLTRNLFGRQLA